MALVCFPSTGTYLTHEAKGSDDAPDADTAIINAEGGNSGAEDKKEYFIWAEGWAPEERSEKGGKDGEHGVE